MTAWLQKLDALIDRWVPAALAAKPETLRRSRLIIRFSVLGALFGFCYASFYCAVGHYWGAWIIVFCSLAVASIPWVLRATGSVEWAGNSHALVLTSGFVALCCVEGGVEGHAIAWLVSVPLCALLLAGKRSALIWCGICLLAAGTIITLDSLGFHCPILYPPEWHKTISAAGYLGLIAFMFLLGRIFETGRERAFNQMTMALVELSEANSQLRKLNEEKDEFLSIAAHDLKNPLTSIMGRGELMLQYEQPTQKDIRDSAAQIVAASSRMRELITNLLDLNAFEQDKFRLKVQVCLVANKLAECVLRYKADAEKKRIQVTAEPVDDPMLAVVADPGALMQILENLMSNALKYSPLGKQVRLRAFTENSMVIMEVEDEGPGISEADQKKMFAKFGRLTAQPTGGESSTGLGLSIVKKMVESMSGSVYCRSMLGRGSTFCVALPRIESAENSVPASSK